MMDDNNSKGKREQEMELLKQLFHLKSYEIPEVARMTRNKQNIMRQVRETSRNKRKSISDLIEVSFPWFFAEPKYGVAVLFVAFAALQYVGINAKNAAQSNTGIYTNPAGQFAAYEFSAETATNSINYPEFPRGETLFQQPRNKSILTPVGIPLK